MQNVPRLITQFIPDHYQLSLDLQRKQRTFSGTVTISGVVVSDAMIFHAKGLAIESVTFDGKAATWTEGENDEVTVRHDDITAGQHLIVVGFNGTITDAMHGLYPCYYTHEGVAKELLATQFESHHAREAFPCIDEPEAKATFDLTLTTEKDVTVLSNMPERRQTVENDRLVTQFDTTPRMSTYLLAWVAGELHRKTATTKSGVEVNVWATPVQPTESLDFALEIATKTIDFFNDYFDTPYPLPKSDHVALPDFSAGAMENWGLVTYREVALLADPATTSISGKQYIATVIAHELSHQWFGNLVTMKWWNNLWLNESFATLMEYIAVDALHPEWNVWLDFATGETISALRRDCLDGVQPVQVDVHHPDEISALFDPAIVYAKGARLLRMLHHYIGNEAFQRGLKNYFAEYAYKNTEADDLWQALGHSSNKDISDFMNSWISQPGFPVVRASLSGSQLTIAQEQFFVGPHEPSAKLWPIPLNASAHSLPDLLDTEKQTITFSKPEALRLNVGDTAHFITAYDNELFSRLLAALRSNTLQPLDRIQLLDEQTLLARGGVTSTATLVPLVQAFTHETIESVWDIISMATSELRKFVEQNEVAEKKLRALSATLADEQYMRLGWTAQPSESESDTKLRATIIGMTLYGEIPEAIEAAIQLYKTNTLEQLNPELRGLIIGGAVRYGSDPTIIDTLLNAYSTTASSDIQLDIASGLTSSKDPAVLRRLLELIKNEDSPIRHQDAVRWFVWILRNRDGRELAWQWLQQSWDWIQKTFGSDKSYDSFPRYAANLLTTRQQLEEYKTFFMPLQAEPSLTRVISIGISEIEGRVALIERDREAVRKALTEL